MVPGYMAAFSATLLPFLMNAASVPAAGSVRSGECVLSARVVDPDTVGTNVRAGPGGAILTRIPREQRVGGDAFSPELEIVGFDRGWARVRSVRFADYGNGEILLFRGPGWISGKHLSADLTQPLRTAPSSSAPMLSGGPSSASLDEVEVLAIDDCRDRFAHVVARTLGGRVVSGWTERLCANQATTCS